MADSPARPDDGRAHDADDEPDGLAATLPLTGRDVVDALVDRARIRLRWAGAGRIAGAAGAALVLAGLGWWLLRSPAVPTEAVLPMATHPADTVAPTAPTVAVAAPATTATQPSSLLVHVAGAVNQPGVYRLTPGQRVADAVAAAGGATADADPDVLNLAAPVADGDRIEVPLVGASLPAPGDAHTHAESASTGDPAADVGPIDLNDATSSELEQLPGIGPTTASAIVEHRTRHGPFATVDDLLDVPGIGPAKLDAIRDRVTT